MSGFVAIYRKLIGDPQFRGKDDEYAAIWLVCKAAWKAYTTRVGRYKVALERGQVACAVSYLSEAWECSKSTVHGRLKHLEKNNFIRTEVRTGYTIITICNYSKYQDALKEAERSPERSPNDQPNAQKDEARTINNEVSDCKIEYNQDEKNKPERSPNASPNASPNEINGNKVNKVGGGNAREGILSELQNEVIRVVQPIANDRLRTAFVQGDQRQLSLVATWATIEVSPEQILSTVQAEVKRLTSQGETISSLNYFSRAIERQTQNGPNPSAAPTSHGKGLLGHLAEYEENRKERMGE
jgi:hypothetical protein